VKLGGLFQKRHFWTALLGVFYAASFAPGPIDDYALPWLQFLILAGFVHQIWGATSLKQSLWTGFVFGWACFTVGLYWLTISMHVYGQMPIVLAVLALLLFAAYLALFPALAAGLTHWLKVSPNPSHGALSPLAIVMQASTWASAWTLAEWLRGTLFTGFPWLNTAYGQTNGWLAGWSTVGGAYGTTFVTAWICGAVAATLAAEAQQNKIAFTPKRGLAVAIAIVLVFVGASLQQTVFTEPQGESLTVRLVQGNIDQGAKFDEASFTQAIDHHINLAGHRPERTEQTNPEPITPALILLPETVVNRFAQQVDASIWRQWVELADRDRATILMGVPLFDATTREYTNSVISVKPGETWQRLAAGDPSHRYDKQHLVPFGEFVPWGFRWFVDLMQIPLGDFTRGTLDQPSFVIQQQRVAANICYEDVFGHELLPAVKQGATILANFSNLGWFGDSVALRQHWQMARFRAIETQRPMLRSTNTGMTGAINEFGQPIALLPAMVAGYVDVQIQGRTGLTPYVRWGDYPFLLLACGILILALFGRRRRQP
jgi:apolipoprotein N-acyltransferase